MVRYFGASMAMACNDRRLLCICGFLWARAGNAGRCTGSHGGRYRPDADAGSGLPAVLRLDEDSSGAATSIQLIPTTVLALRAAAGSADAGAIVLPSLVCTAVSTAVGAVLGLICRRRREARRA